MSHLWLEGFSEVGGLDRAGALGALIESVGNLEHEYRPGVVAQPVIPALWEAEAGGSPVVSLVNMVKPHLC